MSRSRFKKLKHALLILGSYVLALHSLTSQDVNLLSYDILTKQNHWGIMNQCSRVNLKTFSTLLIGCRHKTCNKRVARFTRNRPYVKMTSWPDLCFPALYPHRKWDQEVYLSQREKVRERERRYPSGGFLFLKEENNSFFSLALICFAESSGKQN